ncbi:Uncharacterised protein [Mycobacteroides abscessus subsp. abscessus]|nr:Uncharacterised protein [Mycobacteroides abscessus subsp. abscessus]
MLYASAAPTCRCSGACAPSETYSRIEVAPVVSLMLSSLNAVPGIGNGVQGMLSHGVTREARLRVGPVTGFPARAWTAATGGFCAGSSPGPSFGTCGWATAGPVWVAAFAVSVIVSLSMSAVTSADKFALAHRRCPCPVSQGPLGAA